MPITTMTHTPLVLSGFERGHERGRGFLSLHNILSALARTIEDVDS